VKLLYNNDDDKEWVVALLISYTSPLLCRRGLMGSSIRLQRIIRGLNTQAPVFLIDITI